MAGERVSMADLSSGMAKADADLCADRLVAEVKRGNGLRAMAAQMHDALRKAEQFIVNGVELGFIRMPDPGTPDPAHDTLPAIRAALNHQATDQAATKGEPHHD